MNEEILKVKAPRKKYYYPIVRKRYYENIKNNEEFKIKNSEQYKKWRTENRDKVSEKNKNWREKNKEEHLKRKREAYNNRIQEDPLFTMHEKIRGLIKGSFKRGKAEWKKNSKTQIILGCSIEEFIKMILDKCPEGVGIKDFGQFGYHLDHIIPISIATSEEEIIKLNHYSNFQPLWWENNLSKSNKII